MSLSVEAHILPSPATKFDPSPCKPPSLAYAFRCPPLCGASQAHASMRPLVSQSPASTMPSQAGMRKGSAFWLCFLAIVVCNILSALDVTAVSTVLPTVTHDLGGDNNFVWVGAAYGLASTAALPFCGRLADVFGRRPVMLMAVAFFFVGSALCGSARSMHIIIVARSEWFACTYFTPGVC